MQSLTSAALLTAAVAATNYPRACQEPDVVQNFDMDAYLGRWYEIYRDIDDTFEYGVCATANYSLRADGDIRVRNNEFHPETQEWSGGEGKAYQKDPSADEGYLKVQFSPYFAGDYKILYTDYTSVSVVYSCLGIGNLASREYVWILSRTPQIPEASWETAVNVVNEQIPLYEFEENAYLCPQTPNYPCDYNAEPL